MLSQPISVDLFVSFTILIQKGNNIVAHWLQEFKSFKIDACKVSQSILNIGSTYIIYSWLCNLIDHFFCKYKFFKFLH
jgi:hypothetical protein